MKTQNMVVCIDGIFTTFNHNKKPIEGEIYEVDGTATRYGKTGYYLVGFYDVTSWGERIAYNIKQFRPIDTTYGEVVCETIEQQIELEKVLV